MPPRGMYTYSLNQVPREICHRRQNSVILFEIYGIIKVFRKMKAQHVAHAHGHIGITGKVEIDLEGKGQDRPSIRIRTLRSCRKHGLVDLRPQGAGADWPAGPFCPGRTTKRLDARREKRSTGFPGPGVQLRRQCPGSGQWGRQSAGGTWYTIGSEAYDIRSGHGASPRYTSMV